MDGVHGISLDFVQNCVQVMVQEGRLTISGERFVFTDQDAVRYFKLKLNRYYADIIDYALENRRVVRIVLLEALKGGETQGKPLQDHGAVGQRAGKPSAWSPRGS